MNRLYGNSWLSLDVLVSVLTSFILTITGQDVNIKAIEDCDKTYNLTGSGEVNIKITSNVFTAGNYRCTITVDQLDDSEFPQVCVTPVTVELGGCMVEIDIHNGYFISDNYEDKQYTCEQTSYEEDCTYLDGQVIVFRRVGALSSEELNIHLKIWSKRKAGWVSSDDDSGGLELKYILMIIGASCSVLSCLCGLCYKCLKYNAAEEEAAGYPAVQYQTATQGDTGYQPSEGFQKSGFEPSNTDGPAGAPPSYDQALEMKQAAPT